MDGITIEDIKFAESIVGLGADVNLPLPTGGETALHKFAIDDKYN